MKRAFLTDLGIDGDVIDKIMKEYGQTVNSLKDELDKVDGYKSQIDDLKTQLSDRDKQLEELSEKAKGSEELTKQIEDLKEQNKQTAKDYQSKLDQQTFEFKLDKVLTESKAKNPKAVKALLDLENVKLDGDNLLGLEDQLSALKESDAYLFGEDEPKGLKGRSPNPNVDPSPQTNNPFKKDTFNLTEQGQLIRNDPEKAKQLISQAGLNPANYGL